ncbi:HAMP domain-containing histidine kinase [Pseudomonas sp. BN102]|nr:HAMP domain-containing histidine kinase [Pseudomonas sp. BN102]
MPPERQVRSCKIPKETRGYFQWWRPVAVVAETCEGTDARIKAPWTIEEMTLMQQLMVSDVGGCKNLPAVDLLMLAAISHDLQTPIARMKLRVEQMDASLERDRLWGDLEEMQHMIRAGLAYARSMEGAKESLCKVDLDAFLNSLVCDYQDSGQAVSLGGRSGVLLETRPHALRRVLTNLIDNALKFAGSARLEVQGDALGGVRLQVLDEGPGIAEAELAKVFKPFYRVESARIHSAGGTGLGLAIAQQLSQALRARLSLCNREGGGLCVQLEFCAPS